VLALGDDVPLKASRTLLKKSDHTIAKVWRELKRKGISTSTADDVLFAEAAASGDLSFLLSNKGEYLKLILRNEHGRGARGNHVFEALSDLMGAMTKDNVGGVNFGFGHGREYYKANLHHQGTEAFANLTELEAERAVNKLLDEIVDAFAPNLSKWYDEMLDLLNAELG
jgi:hypothetical protein